MSSLAEKLKIREDLFQSAYLQLFVQPAWLFAVFLMPITSLPVLIHNSGATTVAPPAVLLFLLLSGLWFAPAVFLFRQKIPVESTPLLVFLGAALFSWAMSMFLPVPPFRGQTPLSEGMQAFLTLVMAGAVYLLAAAYLSKNKERLRLTLLVINLSGLALIVWSLVQGYYAFYHESVYPGWVVNFQELLSIRRAPLFYARVTGAAYEPSWLAHQLNMVYLPVWLAASLRGYTALGRKLWRISAENVLLAGGFYVLLITFSRVGILAFMLVLAYLALGVNLRLARRIQKWAVSRLKIRAGLQPLLRVLVAGILLMSFSIAYLGAILGLAYVGSFYEPRLNRIFNRSLELTGFFEVTNQLAFAERVVYWATGWEIFNDYPFLGVGPGNAGFFFQEKMPVFGYALWEVSQIFNYTGFIPNTKSMWVRILAETGIVGFAVFAAWYYLLWRSARLARKSSDKTLSVVGLAGQLALVAFLIEGFSIDSYALPYFWFMIGMSTAAAFQVRRMVGSERGMDG
jgi:O-antigen ligase